VALFHIASHSNSGATFVLHWILPFFDLLLDNRVEFFGVRQWLSPPLALLTFLLVNDDADVVS
jgi:hypothetical protein